MKKSLLAVAIAAAAFAASAASAATVYDKDGTTLAVGGQIEFMAGKYYFGNASDDTTTRDRARVTMSGRTQLTDGIAAYAYNEWEINHKATSQEDQKVNARQQYLGVDFGKFGKVQVGRYTDPFEYASNLVDVLDEVGIYGGFDERNSGHLSYMWSGFGFDAGVSYQFAVDGYRTDAGLLSEKFNVDSGFSLYAGYTTPSVLFGPISIRAAYLYLNGQDKNDGQQDLGEIGDSYHSYTYMKNAKAVDVALAWGTNGKGLYLATNYSYSKVNLDTEVYGYTNNADTNLITYGADYRKAKAWESVVTYGFDNGVRIGASYHRVKFTDGGSYINHLTTDEVGTMKWVELIADYNVTPNFKVWVEGIIDAGSTDASYYTDQEGYGKITSNHDVNAAGSYGADVGNGHNTVLVGARYVF